MKSVAFALMVVALALPARSNSHPLLDDAGASAFYRWQTGTPPPGRLLRSEPIGRERLPSMAGSGERLLYSSSSDFGTERAIVASGAV